MSKFTFPALAALALISVQASADIINVEGAGVSLDQPFSANIREAMDGMSDEVRGLISGGTPYGQHKIRMSKTFTNFEWWMQYGDSAPSHGLSEYQFSYAVDFEDATAQSNWLSKINNLEFVKPTTNSVLANGPYMGSLYNMQDSSIAVNTLPSSSLDSLNPLIARDTHYYQIRLSATISGNVDFSGLEFLDHDFNDLIKSGGTYASRDSGLTDTSTEQEIAAYAADNYISGYDMRMEFDTIAGSEDGYDFEAVYTFWHSAEASDQVTADLDAATAGNLYLFENSIGPNFGGGLTNQQTTVYRSVAVPEPSSTALLLGAFCSGLMIRRRKAC